MGFIALCPPSQSSFAPQSASMKPLLSGWSLRPWMTSGLSKSSCPFSVLWSLRCIQCNGLLGLLGAPFSRGFQETGVLLSYQLPSLNTAPGLSWPFRFPDHAPNCPLTHFPSCLLFLHCYPKWLWTLICSENSICAYPPRPNLSNPFFSKYDQTCKWNLCTVEISGKEQSIWISPDFAFSSPFRHTVFDQILSISRPPPTKNPLFNWLLSTSPPCIFMKTMVFLGWASCPSSLLSLTGVLQIVSK